MKKLLIGLCTVTAAVASAHSSAHALGALSEVEGQTPAREQLARGQALWDQRLSKSAIAALEAAARDKETAAAAHEALGRIYTYKGWLQDNVLPGWHDEQVLQRQQQVRTGTHCLVGLRKCLASGPEAAQRLEPL